MIKKLLIKLENRLIGRKRWQGFFEMLHRISVRGMNYMKGHTVGESGELWAMAHVQSQLDQERPLIFDVGANKGYYAECLYKQFGEAMDLKCFEPARQSCLNLSETLKSIPPAQAVQIGFGKVDEDVVLHYNHEGSTIATLYPMMDLNNKTNLVESETIVLRRIDSYCEDAGIKRIDFLKIDVEGAEYDVLEGCGQMLHDGSIPYIQFEFGPNNMVSKTYMKDFFRILSHYKIHRIVQNGMRELPTYHEIYEIPLVINFLAVYKG